MGKSEIKVKVEGAYTIYLLDWGMWLFFFPLLEIITQSNVEGIQINAQNAGAKKRYWK